MALKQYFNIVLVPLKFIPKRTASFWQTIKIPNRFVLKICTGGFADYTYFMKKKRESIILFLYLPPIILNRYGRIHRYSHQSRRYPDRKHHGPIRDLVHSQGYTGH